jgi:winged helix DNA-binding protein
VRERVLSSGELNRTLLARQLLLDRTDASPVRAMERMAGIQSQYAPSGYIGLWSRVQDFHRSSLTRALERGRAVTGTLMRITIHTVSARDYALFAEGVRRSRRSLWLRSYRTVLDENAMRSAARIVRQALAGGPRRATELAETVVSAGLPRVAWNGAGLWVDLLRVPPSATWERRRADLYDLAERWVRSKEGVTEEAGMRHLVRRYLGGFGPAPVADVSSWAGIPVTTLRPVIEHMRLRRFRDESDAVLFDMPGAPLPDAGVSAPVRFLPTFDATLLISARRARILPEEYRPVIFNTKAPQSVCTFLVNGSVAGTWRHDGTRVVMEPFEKLPARVRREVDAEAGRLAAWHAN